MGVIRLHLPSSHFLHDYRMKEEAATHSSLAIFERTIIKESWELSINSNYC